jgi:hypothetical protein
MGTHVGVALVILLVFIVSGIIIGLLLDQSLCAPLCHELRLEGEVAYLLLVKVSSKLFDFDLDLLAILNELLLGALSARAAIGFSYKPRSPADNWAVRVLSGLYLLSLLLQGIQCFRYFFLAAHPLLI